MQLTDTGRQTEVPQVGGEERREKKREQQQTSKENSRKEKRRDGEELSAIGNHDIEGLLADGVWRIEDVLPMTDGSHAERIFVLQAAKRAAVAREDYVDAQILQQELHYLSAKNFEGVYELVDGKATIIENRIEWSDDYEHTNTKFHATGPTTCKMVMDGGMVCRGELMLSGLIEGLTVLKWDDGDVWKRSA